MTDEQKPAPPERIWMRAEVLSSPELREHFARLNNDDIPYARVHPVDDARVEEIVERQRKRKEAFAIWKERDIIPDSLPEPEALTDIDELLSMLLPQLSSGGPRTEDTPIFRAYNQAIEDAKAAIRGEKVDDPYAAATFINAIARKCSPHVYVAQLSAPVETSHFYCVYADGYADGFRHGKQSRMIERDPRCAGSGFETDGITSCNQCGEATCHVSVTGKHRIDPPYCKDCGEQFPILDVAATGAGEGEQGWLTCAKCGRKRDMAGTSNADFLCRYCFSTEFAPVAEGEHVTIDGEKREVIPCPPTEATQPDAPQVVEQVVYVSKHPLHLHCNTCGLEQAISLQCPREDGQLVVDNEE